MGDKIEILLLAIVQAITRHTPDPVIVSIGNSIALQVAGEDHGRCVGKNGRVIWSLQTLIWYAGMAQVGFPMKVNLVEPKVKFYRPPSPLLFRANWNRTKIQHLLQEILLTCIPIHASFTSTEEGETCVSIRLIINKYLEGNMKDPSFVEALSTILRVAGLNHGVTIKTEAFFE